MVKPQKNWRFIGEKCFSVLKYGGRKTKKICRRVYTEKTLARGHPLYWFELYNGSWHNTTKKGIKNGIVASRGEFWRLKKNL